MPFNFYFENLDTSNVLNTQYFFIKLWLLMSFGNLTRRTPLFVDRKRSYWSMFKLIRLFTFLYMYICKTMHCLAWFDLNPNLQSRLLYPGISKTI
jgi:hypothetical protein